MADISLSELLSKAGTTTGDFLTDVGNGIADNYCGLYRDYPRFAVGVGFDPITPFRRALADSLCKDRPPGLPPPPTESFSGGQCTCLGYNVTISVTDAATNILVEEPTEPLWGEFKGIVTRYTTPDRTEQSAYLVCRGFIADSPDCGELREYLWRTYTNVTLNYSVVSVDAINGIDSCGSPPPDYPVDSPPPDRRNPSIPYNPPSGGGGFTIPLIFTPITNNLDFGVDFDWNGDFNFTLDAGGITVNRGGGGGGGDGGFTPADRGTLGDAAGDAGRAASSGDKAASEAAAAADASRAAKAAAESAKAAADKAAENTEPPPPPDSPKLKKEDKPEEEKNKDDIDGLVYVIVNLTRLPDKGNFQFGDGAPNVYYAGWFEWKFGNRPAPRQPINFTQSLFVTPPGATGYAFTLTNNARGYATEITRNNGV